MARNIQILNVLVTGNIIIYTDNNLKKTYM